MLEYTYVENNVIEFILCLIVDGQLDNQFAKCVDKFWAEDRTNLPI